MGQRSKWTFLPNGHPDGHKVHEKMLTSLVIRETKGTFHAKMGTIKDRNGKDLTKAEDVKKRRQEYTEELYRKPLKDLDNHDGLVTHLEPNILEWEVESVP